MTPELKNAIEAAVTQLRRASNAIRPYSTKRADEIRAAGEALEKAATALASLGRQP